jgi:broad specificity phosphatase PhoE
MKLIIVRHGETTDNVKHVLMGKNDGKLTQKGIEQAKEVGRHLKDHHKIDMVFCSPLGRCVETLENILEEYPIEGEIFMSKLIEERDFGEFTGVDPHLVSWEKVNEDNKINQEMGIESWDKVKKRVELFLEDLKLEDNEKTILIVSHGGPIRIMTNKLNGQELEYEEMKIDHCQIMEFDYETSLEF